VSAGKRRSRAKSRGKARPRSDIQPGGNFARELQEALDRQAATDEILQVISSSSGDLGPVFQSVLANATRLCEANFGILLRVNEGEVRADAMVGVPPPFADFWHRGPQRPGEHTAIGELLRTKRTVHILDVTAQPAYRAGEPVIVAAVRLGGFRTFLAVPMIKGVEVIGVIAIYRQEVRAFTEYQIAVVTNFAAQAVIAIENTRLLNELRQRTNDLSELLEQQTATSEVLKVISNSPADIQPVLEAVAVSAGRLCRALDAAIFLRDGEVMVPLAHFGSLHLVPGVRRPINRDWVTGRAVLEVRTIQVPDLIDSDEYPEGREAALRLGHRAILSVPMIREGVVIGTIVIRRGDPGYFADKQVELVQNFAAQAVIAIENTRLLNELRQSLEQQTATSEVLKVISSSTGDLQPVFQAVLENATRLCGADLGNLHLYDDGRFETVAWVGATSALDELYRERGRFVPKGGPLRALLKAKSVVHSVGISAERVESPAVKLSGARAHLVVPMLREDELVGAVVIYRREERPFTDKQIELLQNFAAQAVIAIENARLLNELRQRTDDLSESLEQQTATSEVLKVISASPGELQPVFQSMLENAIRICEAKFGVLHRFETGLFYPVASQAIPAALAEYAQQQQQGGGITPLAGSSLDRLMRTKAVVHNADELAEQVPGAPARLAGARSLLAVPMLKDGELIGAFIIYRQEVRPFAEKQIDLIRNFAAQAVIAIENARLLSELRQRTDELTESLEQQTATSEVLKVISSSPGNLQSVFQAMLDNATRICGAGFGTLFRIENDEMEPVAHHNVPPVLVKHLTDRGRIKPRPGSTMERVVSSRDVVHVVDLLQDHDAPGNPAVQFAGARTYLGVPMLKEGELVGAIVIYRLEVRPFTGKQIELVQNFAAQAVIAIENTRLLGDLRETLQQQTATADVLKVISRSTFDLKAVLTTLVESAARLCDADMAGIARPEAGVLHFSASYGYPDEFRSYMRAHPLALDRGSIAGRVALEGQAVHVADVLADTEYKMTELARIGGLRTVLGIPLLREGKPIGVIVLHRNTVQPFTDKQVELITTFADQAVIAIENVRLFDEIQDKSRQLAEASQHKSQFLANMSHELRTPLNAILGYTELISDGVYGAPPEKMHAVLKRVESNGKHLLGLINAVLDLSKIEAGQLTLDLADYSLADVTQTVYSAVEALAMDKKLAFKADVAPNLPRGRGDERRLAQVLLNLVGNAIKFTDTGEVVISANANNGTFNVSVRDTGPGISAADQAKLFQEFQQADNSITRKKGGTGLGLAISKRIVEMHGGKIWLESHVGHGSTFFVTLPVRAEEQAN
jgi:GAF domain-containing protein